MVNMGPFISYQVNTFNRLPLLKNLLKSFDICNQYPHYQWVIADYGSTDGTRAYLLELSKTRGDITVLLGDEEHYFSELKEMDLYPVNRDKRIHSIFGKSKNDMRNISRGQIYADIADDHQFIRKENWVQDIIDVYNHREEQIGKDDICSIIYRGLALERIYKKNNETEPVQKTSRGVEYYVAKHKNYDDYHFMKEETYQKMGPYFQPDALADKEEIRSWREGNYSPNHYEDYLHKSKQLHLKKVFLKYPFTIQFPNFVNTPQPKSSGLFVDPISIEQLKHHFETVDRPISTDEIISLSLHYNSKK